MPAKSKRDISPGDLKARYEAGETIRELAASLGVSTPTILQWMTNDGTPRRPRSSPGRNSKRTISSSELAARYNAGETCREIGETEGVHRCTVQEWLERDGIPRRKCGLRPRPRSPLSIDPQLSRADNMARFRQAGETLVQIGGRYGVSRQRVHQILQRAE